MYHMTKEIYRPFIQQQQSIYKQTQKAGKPQILKSRPKKSQATYKIGKMFMRQDHIIENSTLNQMRNLWS